MVPDLPAAVCCRCAARVRRLSRSRGQFDGLKQAEGRGIIIVEKGRGFTRSLSGAPLLEGLCGKYPRWQCKAGQDLSAAGLECEVDKQPRQATHQANGLADDPGKGRHNDSVRGMEDRYGSIPLRVLRTGSRYPTAA